MPVEGLPEWWDDLVKISLDSRLRRKESLKRFNTWRIGGDAECLIDVVNLQDLRLLLTFIQKHRIPWFIIGKGSNLLVSDKTWPGIILHLSGHLKCWEPIEENFDSEKKKVFAGPAAFPRGDVRLSFSSSTDTRRHLGRFLALLALRLRTMRE